MQAAVNNDTGRLITLRLQDEMQIGNIDIQPLDDECLQSATLQLHVARLDQLHPVISGNKWFKLKYFLRQVKENNYDSVATFGGTFSNHILATAYACNKMNVRCTAFIRGERPKQLSQTLTDAQALNTHLEFLSRADYANKPAIMQKNASMFFIPEGGYGITGARGAADIIRLVPDASIYNYIICAVGTGTTLAGIANAALHDQQCMGISVMKSNHSLETETFLLLDTDAIHHTKILHDYHFGGYAKYTQRLIDFMNKMWATHNLPLDFVYTAKALWAVYHLAENKYFVAGSKILFIHSGGLQGNRSLKEKTLLF